MGGRNTLQFLPASGNHLHNSKDHSNVDSSEPRMSQDHLYSDCIRPSNCSEIPLRVDRVLSILKRPKQGFFKENDVDLKHFYAFDLGCCTLAYDNVAAQIELQYDRVE